MDSDIYSIYLDDSDGKASVKDLLKRYELELSKRIIKGICKAIEEGKSYVEVARIVTPHQIITLKSSEALFLETLKLNLNTLISYEEYELCAEAQRFINKLSQKKLE